MGSSNCKSFTPLPCGSVQQTSSVDMKPTYTNEYIEEVICKESVLEENQMHQFDIGEDGKILVVKQEGKIYALGSKCSHYGARLVTGALGKGRVRCPWHGACFNLATGDIEDFPGMDSIHSFKVILESGNVKIRAKKSEIGEMRRLKPMAHANPANAETMVVIGGGPSAAVCVETMRQEAFTGKIYLICREEFLPYDRVKLSKQLNFDIEKTQLRSQSFYDEYDIQVRTGTSAVKVDCENNQVSLSDGDVLSYDKLYIATGARAAKLPIEGSDLENVMVLRDITHAKQALTLLKPTNEVVILGGSFISIEMAAFSTSKVKKVTVVMRDSLPFRASFGDEVGARVMSYCEEFSIEFMPKSRVTRCIGVNGVLTGVVINDETTIKADLFLMAVGTKLNTEFLADSGIKMNPDGSIVVDRFMKTNVDNVYAGGDVAYAPVYCNFNQPAVIGHYPLAHYHGRIAGLNMAGRATPCKSVPFFWTMIFGKSLRYTGYGKFTSTKIVGSLEDMSFVVYYFDDQDRVTSMMSLNKDPVVAQYAEWLSNGKHLYRRDLLEDPLGWTKESIF